jgi:hypothetical protein
VVKDMKIEDVSFVSFCKSNTLAAGKIHRIIFQPERRLAVE